MSTLKTTNASVSARSLLALWEKKIQEEQKRNSVSAPTLRRTPRKLEETTASSTTSTDSNSSTPREQITSDVITPILTVTDSNPIPPSLEDEQTKNSNPLDTSVDYDAEVIDNHDNITTTTTNNKPQLPSLQLEDLQVSSSSSTDNSSNNQNATCLSSDRIQVVNNWMNDHDDSFTTDDELSTTDSISLMSYTPRDDLVTPNDTPRVSEFNAGSSGNLLDDLDSDLSSSSSSSSKLTKLTSIMKYKAERSASMFTSGSSHKKNESSPRSGDNTSSEGNRLKRGNTLLALPILHKGRIMEDKLNKPKNLADLDLTLDEIIEEDLVGGAGFNFQLGTAIDKQREYFNMVNIGRHLSLEDNIKGFSRALVSDQLQTAKAIVKNRAQNTEGSRFEARSVSVLRPHEYGSNRCFRLDLEDVDINFSREDIDIDPEEEWEGVFVNEELMEKAIETPNALHEPEVAFKNALYEEEVIHLNPLFEPLTHSIYSSTNIEQEEASLINAIKTDLVRKDRRVSAFVVKKQVFCGSDLVDWIQNRANFHLVREDCVFFAQQLMDRLVFKCSNMSERVFVDSSSVYYRFVEEYASPECLNILPEQYGIYRPPSSHNVVSRRLASTLEKIANDFQDRKNENDRADRLITIHTFDYRGLSESDHYGQMKNEVSSPLHKLNPMEMSYVERKAFFLNLYNTFILHALITCGRPTNTLLRQQFFKLTKYVVGRYKLSLDNIYHGVLRGALYRSETGERIGYRGAYQATSDSFSGGTNSSSDSKNSTHNRSFNTSGQYGCSTGIGGVLNFRLYSFSSYHEKVIDDLHIRPFDPRIHFALYQGNLTSPQLMAYHPDRLEEQLDEAAREYITNHTQINFKTNTITLSKIFEWYQKDFARDERGVLEYIMRYLEVDKRGRLAYFLRDDNDGKWTVEYHYDWLLNNRMNAHDKQSDNTEVRLELDEVRNDPAYRHYFMSFCEIEHSTENLEFWLEVQKYKKIKDSLKQIKAAKRIAKTFLGPTSLKEINVSRNLIRSVEVQINKAAEQTKIKARETPRNNAATNTNVNAMADALTGTTTTTPITPKDTTSDSASEPTPVPVRPDPTPSAPPKKKRKELLLPVSLFDKLEEEMEMIMTDTFSRFKQHELYDEMVQICVTDFIMDNLAVTLEGEDVGELDFFEALKAQQQQELDDERSAMTESIREQEKKRSNTLRAHDPLRLFKSILLPEPEDVTMSDQEFLQKRRESIEKKRRTRKNTLSFDQNNQQQQAPATPTSARSFRNAQEALLMSADSFIQGSGRPDSHHSL